MVHAFVMVKTDAGTSEETAEAIANLDSVLEAHVIAGDFDIIVEVNTEEVYEILHTASSSIQGINGVLNTKTYIALDD